MGRTFQEFYDIFLLAFAFSHGVNGLRQVLGDFVKTPGGRRVLDWGVLLFWLVLTTIGAADILGGAKLSAQ